MVQWLDLVTKRHEEVFQKARNYVGSEEQVRSVLSCSEDVASSKRSKKPRNLYGYRVSGQNKTVSMTSVQRKKRVVVG